MQMPPRMSQVLDTFIWFCVASMFTITVERRLLPAAIGYFFAFAIGCWRPSILFAVMSASNFVMTLTAVNIWARAPKSFSG
jgi:hypothetical protein